MSDQTGIKKSTVKKIVGNLQGKSLIGFADEKVYLIRENFQIYSNSSKGQEALKLEVSELLQCVSDVGISSNNIENCFRLKKVHLGIQEKKYFQAMWLNTEQYLERLSLQSQDYPVKDKTVVLWGWSNYEDVMNQYMQV